MPRPGTIVILDTETTGLIKGHHEIIEVCALTCRIEPGLPLASDECTLQIRAQYPERATEAALLVNGRARESLLDGMEIGSALRLLRPVLEGAVVAGHNVATFDLPMLALAFGGDEPWDYHVIDTCQASTPDWLFGESESASLRALCARLGVVNEAPHTARGDADATRRCLAVLWADRLEKLAKEAP